jgi:hypothetical protein
VAEYFSFKFLLLVVNTTFQYILSENREFDLIDLQKRVVIGKGQEVSFDFNF